MESLYKGVSGVENQSHDRYGKDHHGIVPQRVRELETTIYLCVRDMVVRFVPSFC